jgi:hypothetical protein
MNCVPMPSEPVGKQVIEETRTVIVFAGLPRMLATMFLAFAIMFGGFTLLALISMHERATLTKSQQP